MGKLVGFLAGIFGYLLNFIYDAVGNYGLAIILFTIAVQIILLPFTIKQQKTMIKNNKIQAKVKLESKKKKQIVHAKTYRYYTDNSNVATVSKKGVITAKAKGSCLIYVLTNNGVYQKIKVTVK